MGKPKRRLPATAAETAGLTGDQVIEAVFGKVAQQALKQQAVTNDDVSRNDYRMPDYYGGDLGGQMEGPEAHESI